MAQAKNIENFDCGSEAHHAALAILRARLGEMIELQSSALDFTNIEGVHDMRVASRRLRSAMADFEVLFDTGDFHELERQVKITARKLGAVRDEDVAIDALEKIASQTEGEIAGGIREFIEARITHRDGTRQALTRAVTNEKLARLQSEFEEIAAHYHEPSKDEAATNDSSDTASKAATTDAASDDGFRQIGSEIMARRWRKLVKHAASLYRPLEPEPLHRMRIEAKRMRYALDLFDVCFGGALAEFAKEVAVMQGALGDLHDVDVWVTTFGDALIENDNGRGTGKRKSGGSATLDKSNQRAAALWLLDYFTKQRAKHYRVALEQWQQWQTDDFAARLTTAIGSTASPKRARRPATKRRAVTGKQAKPAIKSKTTTTRKPVTRGKAATRGARKTKKN